MYIEVIVAVHGVGIAHLRQVVVVNQDDGDVAVPLRRIERRREAIEDHMGTLIRCARKSEWIQQACE